MSARGIRRFRFRPRRAAARLVRQAGHETNDGTYTNAHRRRGGRGCQISASDDRPPRETSDGTPHRVRRHQDVKKSQVGGPTLATASPSGNRGGRPTAPLNSAWLECLTVDKITVLRVSTRLASHGRHQDVPGSNLGGGTPTDQRILRPDFPGKFKYAELQHLSILPPPTKVESCFPDWFGTPCRGQ